MSDYKKLKVWENAHKITLDIYKMTKTFPFDEKYGLVSQLRRAASSIPTNIVEGCGQLDNGNLIRYLGIAKGSSFEVDYLTLLAKDLEYLNEDEYLDINKKIEQVIRMLTNLIKSLKISKK